MRAKEKKAQGMLRPLVGLIALAFVLGAGPAAAAEDGDLKDYEIRNAVDDQLIGDPATPADRIDVSVVEGIATLSGSVGNVLAKDRAERIAETVKGVRGVVNDIDVTAPFRYDEVVAEDVENALRWNAATESWEISVSVKDGIATLAGVADSWQEKELAAKVAKGVRGVKGIDNEIVVEYQSERSDAEIEKEVRQALRWDAYVDDGLIDVSVKDGKVTLTGEVGSVAEKKEAAYEAWVAGVKAVDNGGLDVKWWARNDKLRRDKYAPKSDAEIEDAVRDAFLYDPRVNRFRIDVGVDNGYATLRGEVENLEAKRAAARDARNVLGVWSVKNRIKVRSDMPADAVIERRIENALMLDPYIERYDITVSVVDGEAHLYGDVDSTFEKTLADDVAARQEGVVEVKNFLTVNDPDAAPYNPYTDYGYPYDYDWYAPPNVTASKTDKAIAEDIRSELFWSPFVDRDDVNVSVDNGVATLTGTVDSWSEREAAMENAWEGGATAVDNDLIVKYYGPAAGGAS